MRTSLLVLLALPALACLPDTELGGSASVAGPIPPGSPASPDAGPPPAVLLDPVGFDSPTNLHCVVLGFPEAVRAGGAEDGPRLVDGSGDVLPLTMGERLACAGACYPAFVGTKLVPDTPYRVELPAGGLVFLDGKPLSAGIVGAFRTGLEDDLFVPRIQAFGVEIREGCVVAELAADEAVRVRVELEGPDGVLWLDSAAAAPHQVFTRLDDRLPTSTLVMARARAIDRAGNVAVSPDQPLLLPDPLPTLSLVELMPNPAGSETTQEWVELLNHGPAPVELGGLVLADKAGGDVLPAQILAPGAHALIVGEGYLPDDPKDVPPRAGTPLVRVPGKLGGDGLSNAGEVVRLLTAKGEVISQYGGHVVTSATAWSGKSVARVAPRACDGPEAWLATPQSPTPGW